ncbi:MAG: PIG-L family deacetylase, partial [Planctomycetota bacterium]
ALALASQTLEGGCGGNETLYPVDDATRRKQREKVTRERFYGRFASTANRFRDELAKWYGRDGAKNIKYAEAFEICEYGRRPSEEEIRKLFPFFPQQ